MGSIVLLDMFTGNLERAVLEALAYSDIFDYPLHLNELHRYLPVQVGMEQLSEVLDYMHVQVQNKAGFYFLAGREEIVDIRQQRQEQAERLLPHALRYGRRLGSLPFVRMVALTGSLAVLNVSKNEDFDYMLVTVPGRVWTARAFAILFNRIVRKSGHTICPNLIISENALEWPLHDLYSARELYQMVLITGMGMYQRLLKANAWAKDFLPNAALDSGNKLSKVQKQSSLFQRLMEFPLNSGLGDHFEEWEMNRKIARFSKQPGFGEETIFTADVCQGNFHHHRKWTREVYERKLTALAAVWPRGGTGGDLEETQSPGTAIGAYLR